MADLESVLADVSYLIALDTAKTEPISIVNKKIVLPHPSIDFLVLRHLNQRDAVNFTRIFHEPIGYNLFKNFCFSSDRETTQYKQMKFYDSVVQFKKNEDSTDFQARALRVYSEFILQEVLENRHEFPHDMSKKLIDNFEKGTIYYDIYDNYLEELEKKLKDQFENFKSSNYFIRYLQWKLVELNLNPSIDQFSIHRIIGRGGFGEVYGCHKNDSGKMFAMKCIDKKRMKIKDGIQLAINERNILSIINSPFIVCMSYCFQTSDKICFILDLMNGGDLNYHVNQKGSFTEDAVRFYAVEIYLGLEYLHNKGIMYRDLKPPNILLDDFGHVKISDLGLACDFSSKKIMATVGTPGYMAPEVIKKGCFYDFSCDLFSFGCLLCKLACGRTPFKLNKNISKHELHQSILNENPILPEKFSAELKSLIQGLLIKDPKQRLGCDEKRSESIKLHVFFNSIDWIKASDKKLTPPFIPPYGEVNAANIDDIGNFNEDDTKKIKLTEEDKLLYNLFDFLHVELWQSEMTSTIFDHVNTITNKLDAKRLAVLNEIMEEIKVTDFVLYGLLQKQANSYLPIWQKKYFVLYPNRLEWFSEPGSTKSVLPVEKIKCIQPSHDNIIKIETLLSKNIYIRSETEIENNTWSECLLDVLNKYQVIMYTNKNLSFQKTFNFHLSNPDVVILKNSLN